MIKYLGNTSASRLINHVCSRRSGDWRKTKSKTVSMLTFVGVLQFPFQRALRSLNNWGVVRRAHRNQNTASVEQADPETACLRRRADEMPFVHIAHLGLVGRSPSPCRRRLLPSLLLPARTCGLRRPRRANSTKMAPAHARGLRSHRRSAAGKPGKAAWFSKERGAGPAARLTPRLPFSSRHFPGHPPLAERPAPAPRSARPAAQASGSLTAVEPFLTASCAYSTWKRWPSGEKTVMARS